MTKTLLCCITAILLLLMTQWGYCAEAALNLRHLQDLERRLETPSGKTFRVWAIYAEPNSAAGFDLFSALAAIPLAPISGFVVEEM